MGQEEKDKVFMARAYELAQHAAEQEEVPVGAVLVIDDQIIAEGWNCPIQSNDPSAHAEVIALRRGAEHIDNYRLINSTLYVTLEPCLMCVGAIVHARVKRLVFAADDPRAGAVKSAFQMLDQPALNHRVSWESGLLAEPCGSILKAFFKARRK